MEKVRATHRNKPGKTWHWRTHEAAFASVWTDLLLWLQHELDCTAKLLLHRLQEKYSGLFDMGQLRTLQRRVGEWRQSMARTFLDLKRSAGAYRRRAHSLGPLSLLSAGG